MRQDAAADATLFGPEEAGSRLGQLTAMFDVVLGFTPEAPDEPVHGGIGPSEMSRGGGRADPDRAPPRPQGRRFY